MRPYPVFAFAAVLALASCGQPTETEQTEPMDAVEPVQQEQATPPPGEEGQQDLAAAQCDPAQMGSVSMTMVGQPGDNIGVTLTCGGVVVAQCTATVAPGAATANCVAGPAPQVAGLRECTEGPGPANSPAAASRTWGCSSR